jgi:hypothetical protein
VTLPEKFSNWIAVSNRNRCLGLAFTLLHTAGDELAPRVVGPDEVEGEEQGRDPE